MTEKTTEAVVLSWNLITNILLIFVIFTVTLLILKWVLSFVLWKWQNMIDERARQQQQQQHNYKDNNEQDDSGEEEENISRPSRTTTRRRK